MTYFIDLVVNGESLDTFPENKLKYTLQNNDIAEVKDRQASFSNAYEVPKTPKNVRILGGLSLPSDTSLIPYTKPSCQLILSGFSFIIKGWLTVQDADDSYKLSVYSGIIEFFKSLENKSIGDIIGNELDHVKNLPTVINSFALDTYRYLIADYNGVTHYIDGADNVINIDYLVPSVNVLYLWEKIHSFANMTYSGSVFATEAFTNLWITYPKSINNGELAPAVADTSGNRTLSLRGHDGSTKSPYDKLNFQAGSGMASQTYFIAPDTAEYNFKMKIASVLVKTAVFNVPIQHTDSFYYYSINQEGVPFEQRSNVVQISKRVFGVDGENSSTGVWSDEFELEFIVKLNAGDQISFFTFVSTDQQYDWIVAQEMEVAPYIPAAGSFSEELKNLDATDFFKEVLNQFGLTPYTDEYSSEIRYKNIQERLVDAPLLDWSDKYIRRKSESYVQSNYAQNNRFKYQYNDKEDDFNNSGLLIDNPNLTGYKDVWVSKTYSPEKELTDFYIGSAGSRLTNIFKIYDKSVKESSDGSPASIEYKGLEKRFHFVRSVEYTTTVKIGSQLFNDIGEVESIPMASFGRLDWRTLLSDNYLEMGRILNDARLHGIDVKLNPMDVVNLDLFCLVYFAQEQQYYLINKLTYNGDPVTNGSFVRVKRETDQVAQFYIRIVWNDNTEADKVGSSTGETVKLFSITPPAQNDEAQYSWEMDSGAGFVSLGAGVTPKDVSFPTSGVYDIRYKSVVYGMTYYSNVLRYTRQGSNIFITDFIYDYSTGRSSYNLHVENQTFVGYVNMEAFKQENGRNARVGDTFGGNLSISNATEALERVYKSTAVTIPIGVYACDMSSFILAIDEFQPTGVDGKVSFGLSPTFGEAELASAAVRLNVPARPSEL